VGRDVRGVRIVMRIANQASLVIKPRLPILLTFSSQYGRRSASPSFHRFHTCLISRFGPMAQVKKFP